MKRALVLGAGGQDGSYLCDILLDRGYAVHAMVRHSSVDNLKRIRPLLQPSAEGVSPITAYYGDVTDMSRLAQVLEESDPDEVYNVADQDNVSYSHLCPSAQIDVTYKGASNILELLKGSKVIKLFQPVSATMFGMAPPPQNENTPLDPRSPYAVAKAAVFHLCRHYRQDHDLYINCGIMFNHDSPRRADGYLLGKICKAALAAKRGEPVNIPNSQLKVDISYAKDCMSRAVDLMQLDHSDDYCIGSGVGFTVEEMARCALSDVSMGWNTPLQPEAETIRGPQPTLIADTSKVTALIGNKPGIFGNRHDIRDSFKTIRLIINHLEKEQR